MTAVQNLNLCFPAYRQKNSVALIIHCMFFTEPCPKWVAAVSDVSHDFTAQLEIPVKSVIVKQQQNMNETNNGIDNELSA